MDEEYQLKGFKGGALIAGYTCIDLLRILAMPLLIQESPVEQPAGVKEGYLRPYQRNKKKHVLTRTRQAY